MDARYDWLAGELQNSLGLGAWNSPVGNSLPLDSQSSSLLKNGAMGLSLHQAGGIKGSSRTDDLAAALNGLPVENENGLVGIMGNKMSGEQMVAGLAGNEFLKLGAWNGTDFKPASSIVVSTNANVAGSKDASWGQMPVRQDTAWDNTTAVGGKFTDPVAVVGSGLPTDVPNDGTEIWRSALPSGDLPVGMARDQLKLNGPTLWNDARRVSVPSDPRAHYMMSSAPGPVHPSSWDGSSPKMWGARAAVETAPTLPLRDVLRQLSAPNKFTSSSEADFGVWSHSSATVPTQQPPIDNGTAIWGSPPSLGDTSTSAAARLPTTPALPFSIDLTVPPPPLPKSVVCPPASAWNPSAHMVKPDGLWPGTDASKAWNNAKGNAMKGTNIPMSLKSHNAPQMRSRLLQQLLDMGFRKEDAQNAIIRNNLDMERTLADLLANGGRNRPVGDRPVVGPGYLPSPNGFDVFQGQPAGVVPRGVTPVGGASLQRGPPSPLAPDRLLLAQQQQQLPVGGSTQLTGAHNQTREALVVRSLISECAQLVKLLRALYQCRVSPAMRQRDTEAQVITTIRQVDDKINEKLFGQLLCLPQNSLLVDVKELGYENGALAAMDLVHQFQELKIAAGQSQAVGMQASPPQSYVSPTRLSPNGLGWSASTAGVTVPMTVAVDAKSTVADNSAGKSATSVLEIKEFVPGRPWGSQQPMTDAAASVATATSAAASSQGLGMRCSSLANMEKLAVTSSSRLSTSEWSLDGSVGGSGSNGGSKGTVDPAGSLPTLWNPLDTSAGTPVPSSKNQLVAASLPCTLILKCISAKVDSTMLKSLCASHGRVKSFTPQLDKGEATVTYSVHADAVHAQRALDMCLLGDCHMVAEFGGVNVVSAASSSATLPHAAVTEWSIGTYDHGWSVGDDGTDSSLLPAGLLNDSC